MATSPPNAHGQIITFYSYKGGTGRSMALANVAWILASNGKRVLVVDWDLEAPGLHEYFRPFLGEDPDLESTDGLINMVVSFASQAIQPERSSRRSRLVRGARKLPSLCHAYSMEISFSGKIGFPTGGTPKHCLFIPREPFRLDWVLRATWRATLYGCFP